MQIIIQQRIHIPNLSSFQDEVLEMVNSDLTVENPKFKEAVAAGRSTRGILPVIKNFEVNGGGIYLPRGYSERFFTGMHNKGIPVEIDDKRNVAHLPRSISHSIRLRDYQNNALLNMGKYAEGLLVAPAGSGKTVMGIGLALMCGQKILWITHTKQLLTQFVDRIKAFTDISDDEIGLIHEGNWQTDAPVTVGLVQTMIRDEAKLAEIQNNFGTIIVDECHHVPATTFTQILSTLNPFYLFGLTATPNRRDGLHTLMFQNIGPARHIVPRSAVADGIITPTVIPRFVDNMPTADSYQELLAELVKDNVRNQFIADDVVQQAEHGNICIVSTERVPHTKLLYDLIKAKWPRTGVITGKNKKEEREDVLTRLEAGEITVLICTSHLLGEGFDYAPLNRLFIALPFRNLARCEQLVGRVQRIADGKLDAWILDYIDNHSLAQHQFKNKTGKDCRFNVYRKLGCEIR